MHLSSISTISRTSIFPELSSSKRLKASGSNNCTSRTEETRKGTSATTARNKNQTESRLRHRVSHWSHLQHTLRVCNISLDLEFPTNMWIMANADDLHRLPQVNHPIQSTSKALKDNRFIDFPTFSKKERMENPPNHPFSGALNKSC